MSWLKRDNQNIGAFITTVGKLYQPKYSAVKPETFSELQTLTLNDCLERLEHLSRLLSYANGGYIGPLYVEGRRYSQDQKNPVQTTSAVARPYQTTTLDRLGQPWNTSSSDIAAYVKCFSTFERMMQHQAWQETFSFVLTQYFQTIQNRSWLVMAKSIGAALERLSYTILFEEETDETRRDFIHYLFDLKQPKFFKKQAKEYWKEYWKTYWDSCLEDFSLDKRVCPVTEPSPTGQRLILLLECIGLTRCRGYTDVIDVPIFLEVRNDALHPRTGSLTKEQRWKHINQALQWIDEVVLWRLGYAGEYLDRSLRWRSSIAPRYDLGTRDPAW